MVSLDRRRVPRPCSSRLTGPGEVTAELIECDTAITVHNPDLVIATLTGAVDFEAELTVETGRGYRPASEYYENGEEQVIGEIPIDAIFSPGAARSLPHRGRPGRSANRLRQADPGPLDRRHRLPGDGAGRSGEDPPEAPQPLRHVRGGSVRRRVSTEVMRRPRRWTMELIRKLQQGTSDMELSVRASNCLESAQHPHRRGTRPEGRRRSCSRCAASARRRFAR